MKLRPNIIYWFSRYTIVLFIIVALFISRDYIKDTMIRTYMLAAAFIVIFMLIYSFIDMIYCTLWIITDDRIAMTRGVFHKKRDYVELYRIIDYEETQSFIQLLFNNKTVTVISGDKTHPRLHIYGIDNKLDIIEYLRPRVERQKKIHGIYEITNR